MQPIRFCARPRATPGRASLHLRPVAAAVASARLDPAVTFYALRHSYITHALNAGVPLKAVAEHCGTSVIMISRTYAKVLAGHHARYAAMAAPPWSSTGEPTTS